MSFCPFKKREKVNTLNLGMSTRKEPREMMMVLEGRALLGLGRH